MEMKYRCAVLQLDSREDKEENLRQMESLIREAASEGAKLLLMPETCLYIGRKTQEMAETVPGPFTERMSSLAREYGVYLVAGSITEKRLDGRYANTCTVFGPDGRCEAIYRKLHLFDIDVPGSVFRESDEVSGGEQLVTLATPLGQLGLSICYDLRFCELYRLLALRGAQILLVPACFSLRTGKDHWETLLRARAIENGCYVLAADQIGPKPNGSEGYGRSMVIDPWGNVIAMASDVSGVTYAEIDLELVEKIRRQLPSLANRRGDIYSLTEKGAVCDTV